MTIKRVSLKNIANLKGSTNKSEVDALTESDIKQGILKDPDTPNLNDKELEEFKEPSSKGHNEKN